MNTKLILSLLLVTNGVFALPLKTDRRPPQIDQTKYLVVFHKVQSCAQARKSFWKTGFSVECDDQSKSRSVYSLVHFGGGREQFRSVKLGLKRKEVQAITKRR